PMNAYPEGIATLTNGKWLVTSGGWGGLATLDPHTGLVQQKLIAADGSTKSLADFNYLGRACLSEEVVASRDPALDLPLPPAQCDQIPEGEPLLQVDFEDAADFGPSGAFLEQTHVGVTVEVVDGSSAGSGTHSLRISGGTEDIGKQPSGVYHDFD